MEEERIYDRQGLPEYKSREFGFAMNRQHERQDFSREENGRSIFENSSAQNNFRPTNLSHKEGPLPDSTYESEDRYPQARPGSMYEMRQHYNESLRIGSHKKKMTSKRDNFMIDEILQESVREFHANEEYGPFDDQPYDEEYLDENLKDFYEGEEQYLNEKSLAMK